MLYTFMLFIFYQIKTMFFVVGIVVSYKKDNHVWQSYCNLILNLYFVLLKLLIMKNERKIIVYS